MTDYRQYSFWLETCGDDLTPRPPLLRSTEVDVAILGAGYSGLWTAYYLLRDHPELKVAVVDSESPASGHRVETVDGVRGSFRSRREA